MYRYNKTVDRIVLRPEVDMFINHLIDIHGSVELELITKVHFGIFLIFDCMLIQRSYKFLFSPLVGFP